jgi:phosphoribosylformimino-5-aminoimidazole carboxamide ribotide isomerase
MRIIPAIDIIDGKCVRLSQGDYQRKTVYNDDPLEVARSFEDAGIQYLHLVDLDGAKSRQIVNYKTLEKLCSQTNLKIDFGGGIKSQQDLQIAFDSGASQITAGSVAAKEPDKFLGWLEQYGADKIVLGADCKDRKIASSGWLEQSDQEVIEFIANYQKAGIEYVICTDIGKDGMLEGPSIELYKEILACQKISLIASGGVSSLADLKALKALGCEGAIVGKALYEGQIELNDLAELC